LIHHRGRRSGREFTTPVNVFRAADGYVVALTYGVESDWVKNVLAAGGCEIVTRGQRIQLTNPRITTDTERRWAPPLVRPLLRLVLGSVGATQVMRLTQVG
jgi:deazaflavin-dependent oxidoreductase (nitroreductase family)